MQRLVLFAGVLLLTASSSNLFGQVDPPPGAGDKSLQDRSIKDRSLELERIKRDANKAEPISKEAQELRFREVKEDFEQIQHAQSGVVEAYTKSKAIDYDSIAMNADKMNSGSKRLMGNLFPQPEAKKASKKGDKLDNPESVVPTEIKVLIVNLDDSLAAFTGNPMFTNPQVVNPDDYLKAKADLQKIITLSSILKQEADKLKKP